MENTKRTGTTSLEVRLAKYNLRMDALNADELRVTAQTKVRLDATGAGMAPARWLRPSGIAQLKQWLGVPQAVVSKYPGKFNGRRASTLPPTDLAATLPKAMSGQHEGSCRCGRHQSKAPQLAEHSSALREVIHQYLFGDARELTAFEPVVELKLAPSFPFWLFNRIVVEAGGVLEIGSGINSLVADTVIIESGGEIRCEGSLTIDCGRIARS